jgi:hypothetical protein
MRLTWSQRVSQVSPIPRPLRRVSLSTTCQTRLLERLFRLLLELAGLRMMAKRKKKKRKKEKISARCRRLFVREQDCHAFSYA